MKNIHFNRKFSQYNPLCIAALTTFVVLVCIVDIVLATILLDFHLSIVIIILCSFLSCFVSFITVYCLLKHIKTIDNGLKEYNKNQDWQFEHAEDNSLKQINDLFDKVKTLDNNQVEFIRNVSHELKTPLTSMRILAEGISDGVLEPNEKNMKTLSNEIVHLNDTYNAIRDYVFTDKDTVSGTTSIIQVLNESVNRTEIICGENVDVVFRSTCEIKNDNIPMSPQSVHRIINAVVNNAVEHAEGMDIIEFSITEQCSGECEYIKVSIADNGSGIDEVEKMVIPFWKADTSHHLQRNIDGDVSVGLGLAHVHKTMQSIGGILDITSKPGVGTCISLFFPKINEQKNM